MLTTTSSPGCHPWPARTLHPSRVGAMLTIGVTWAWAAGPWYATAPGITASITTCASQDTAYEPFRRMPNGVYPGIAQHLNRRSGLDGRRLVASARFNWAGLGRGRAGSPRGSRAGPPSPSVTSATGIPGRRRRRPERRGGHREASVEARLPPRRVGEREELTEHRPGVPVDVAEAALGVTPRCPPGDAGHDHSRREVVA